MLYVFYVDVGKRMAFNMILLNGTVLELKEVIEKEYGIPVVHQVLLINGGETLKDSSRVCNYSAGTDTNPIFLFNREFLIRRESPSIVVDYRYATQIENDLNNAYENIINRNAPPTFQTIYRINSMAQKYLDLAMETKSYCDTLHNEQHLSNQGLQAATANLDDVLGNFKSRCEKFSEDYNKYLENRMRYIEIIDRCIDEDLKLLSKIPLLPALLDDNEEERTRLAVCFDTSKKSDITLLNWISSRDPGQCLENHVRETKKTILQYDQSALNNLRGDVDKLFRPDRLGKLHNHSENSDIAEKLMTLSGLIVTIKETYEDQFKNASGIKRNYDRVTELKEDCVLADLLETHRNTITIMKTNNQNLKSCRMLCIQTKKDLCDIIHKRLTEILLLQKGTNEIGTMITLHNGFLKRTEYRMRLVQQIRSAPKNYFAAVSEVVRRRSYSQAFLMWASDLACRIFTIYTEETERRKQFMAEFDGHFLKTLFPGLQDMPPAFATQTPPLFDNNLPALCDDDLKSLCQNVPDFEQKVELPNVEAVRNFFLSRSLTLSEDIQCQEEDANKVVDDESGEVMSGAETSSIPSSSGRFDQAPQKMITSSDSCFTARDSSGMDDSLKRGENMTYETDMQTVRDGMAVLGSLAHTTIVSLRNDLTELRSWAYSQQSELAAVVSKLSEQAQSQRTHIQTLLQTLKSKDDDVMVLMEKVATLEKEKADILNAEKQLREEFEQEREKAVREATEQLTQKHKQEIEALRQRFKLMASTNMERCLSETSLEKAERNTVIELSKHEQIISQLKSDLHIEANDLLQKERAAHEKKMNDLRAKCDADKVAVEENVRKTVFREYKRQVEAMRDRETSLLAELQRHKDTIHTLAAPEGSTNTLMSRVEQLENEKKALETELLRERQMMYSSTPPSQSGSLSMTRSTNPLMSRVEQLESEKKALETELLRERQMMCSSTPPSQSGSLSMNSQYYDASSLLSRAEQLEKEKHSLETELTRGRQMSCSSGRLETELTRERQMSCSSGPPSDIVSLPANSSDGSKVLTNRNSASLDFRNKIRRRDRNVLRKNRSSTVNGSITVQSCKAGDIVLVVWDDALKNYTILQESNMRHFVHPTSYRSLRLPAVPDGSPMFFAAEVLDKEHCAPRRSTNRYNLREGERFYRVKLKPVANASEPEVAQPPTGDENARPDTSSSMF